MLDINVRDYLGAPFIGQAINGIYPCKSVSFQKNFNKEKRIMSLIHNHRKIKYSQDLLITVPDNSRQEYADITSKITVEMSKNKPKNYMLLMHMTSVSIPTKIPDIDTTVIFICCKGFNGVDLDIFKREGINEPASLTQRSIIGKIYLNSMYF